MAIQPVAGSTGGTKTKKTVTVIAYAEHDAYRSERHMADELDAGRDYYERDYRSERTVRLVAESDTGSERTEKVFDSVIADALADASVDGDVRVDVERSVSRPYKYSPSRIVTDLRDEAVRDLPAELSGGVERSPYWAYKWQDDDDVTRVYVRADDVDYRRVLLHRTQRTGRAKWATDRKHLSAKFTIDLAPAADEHIDAWSESIVADFVKALAHVDWVYKVRVADCTESIEREGDCFAV